MVPVAPAAPSVWHELQAAEPVNTVLPPATPAADAPAGAADFAEEAPAVGVVAAPGTPAWLADEGGVPIGGALLAG